MIIQRRKIDLIVVGLRSKAEAEILKGISKDANFYLALREGRYPFWLREVKLPQKLQMDFRLFEVVEQSV